MHRLWKTDIAEADSVFYPYCFAKSRDLRVAFCTSQGASVRHRRACRPLQKFKKVAEATFLMRLALLFPGVLFLLNFKYQRQSLGVKIAGVPKILKTFADSVSAGG